MSKATEVKALFVIMHSLEGHKDRLQKLLIDIERRKTYIPKAIKKIHEATLEIDQELSNFYDT